MVVALESQFPKLETFSESVEPLSRNCDQNLTQQRLFFVYFITHEQKHVKRRITYGEYKTERDLKNRYNNF